MKTTSMVKWFAAATGLLLLAAGCGHSVKESQSVQGHWSGYNTKNPGAPCTVNITGNQFEYRGADPNQWARGTFVLREDVKPKQMDLTVLEPSNQSNQVLLAIYQLEGGQMTVAMSSVQRPVDFNPKPQIEVYHCKRD